MKSQSRNIDDQFQRIEKKSQNFIDLDKMYKTLIDHQVQQAHADQEIKKYNDRAAYLSSGSSKITNTNRATPRLTQMAQEKKDEQMEKYRMPFTKQSLRQRNHRVLMTFSKSQKARNIAFNAQHPKRTGPDQLDQEMVTDKAFDDLQQLKNNLKKVKDPDSKKAIQNKIKYIQVARGRVQLLWQQKQRYLSQIKHVEDSQLNASQFDQDAPPSTPMRQVNSEKDLEQFYIPKMIKIKKPACFTSSKTDTGLAQYAWHTNSNQKKAQAKEKMKKKHGQVAELLEYLTSHENIVYDTDPLNPTSVKHDVDWNRVNQMSSITRNKLGLGQRLKGVHSTRPRDEVDPLRNPALFKQASAPSLIALRMQHQTQTPLKELFRQNTAKQLPQHVQLNENITTDMSVMMLNPTVKEDEHAGKLSTPKSSKVNLLKQHQSKYLNDVKNAYKGKSKLAEQTTFDMRRTSYNISSPKLEGEYARGKQRVQTAKNNSKIQYKQKNEAKIVTQLKQRLQSIQALCKDESEKDLIEANQGTLTPAPERSCLNVIVSGRNQQSSFTPSIQRLTEIPSRNSLIDFQNQSNLDNCLEQVTRDFNEKAGLVKSRAQMLEFEEKPERKVTFYNVAEKPSYFNVGRKTQSKWN